MSRILILKEAPYGSREESPQMTELMNGNYAGKPEACTICGGSPVVAGARYLNPLGTSMTSCIRLIPTRANLWTSLCSC